MPFWGVRYRKTQVSEPEPRPEPPAKATGGLAPKLSLDRKRVENMRSADTNKPTKKRTNEQTKIRTNERTNEECQKANLKTGLTERKRRSCSVLAGTSPF